MVFEVPCHASVGGDPGQRPLDDPALRDDLEAFGRIRPAEDFDRSRHGVFDLFPSVSTISDDDFEEGKPRRQAIKQAGRAIAVLDAGGMDVALEQQTNRVGEDVALAAFDLLARITADLVLGVGTALDRLAVDDGRTRLGGAVFQVAASASWMRSQAPSARKRRK